MDLNWDFIISQSMYLIPVGTGALIGLFALWVAAKKLFGKHTDADEEEK